MALIMGSGSFHSCFHFYKTLLIGTNIDQETFQRSNISLQCSFCQIFWQMMTGKKATRKMLVKLTTGFFVLEKRVELHWTIHIRSRRRARGFHLRQGLDKRPLHRRVERRSKKWKRYGIHNDNNDMQILNFSSFWFFCLFIFSLHYESQIWTSFTWLKLVMVVRFQARHNFC